MGGISGIDTILSQFHLITYLLRQWRVQWGRGGGALGALVTPPEPSIKNFNPLFIFYFPYYILSQRYLFIFLGAY